MGPEEAPRSSLPLRDFGKRSRRSLVAELRLSPRGGGGFRLRAAHRDDRTRACPAATARMVSYYSTLGAWRARERRSASFALGAASRPYRRGGEGT
jgi:hypothetical protein